MKVYCIASTVAQSLGYLYVIMQQQTQEAADAQLEVTGTRNRSWRALLYL
jgi:hypothetical protein